MRHRTVGGWLAVLLIGCTAGPESRPDAGGSACTCQPETALATPYDNASSLLGADNVQDAIDELAGRPAEAPLAGRFYYSHDPWVVQENLTAPNLNMGGECRPGDIAIRVECRYLGLEPIPVLVQTYVNRASDRDFWHCAWSTPNNGIPPGRFEGRALCLDL